MNIMRLLRGYISVPLLFVMLTVISLVSCDKEESTVDDVNKQTILVYMPWSGSANSDGLYHFFLANLDSIEVGLKAKGGITNNRVLIFISESARNSVLYELTYDKKTEKCERKKLRDYEGHDYTTAEGITSLLNEVKSLAPALNYAMMIGCHGTGWTFKDSWDNYPYYSKTFSMFEEEEPSTRFFGSVSDFTFSTNISTLAEGISGAGMKMQYIQFDDCYMCNVEVAYELRNVTNFLIASTSEVMNIGFPYQKMWKGLSNPVPDYSLAISAFGQFYNDYIYPYGTAAAIDCREMDNLASIMKLINDKYTISEEALAEVQVLDGFDTPIFYDFGDYVDKLCTENALHNRVVSSLNTLVKAKANTENIFSMLYNEARIIPVKTFSGITISDPSQHVVAKKSLQHTSWYQATH